MKTKAVIALVSLLLTLATPFSLTISSSGDVPILVTLNVCDAAGSALSTVAGCPAIHECFCNIVPLIFSGYITITNPEYFLPAFTSAESPPPKA